MTGPRTCIHLINARTLTGVCQVVRMFSPCQCIQGTLESNLLSQSTPISLLHHACALIISVFFIVSYICWALS